MVQVENARRWLKRGFRVLAIVIYPDGRKEAVMAHEREAVS